MPNDLVSDPTMLPRDSETRGLPYRIGVAAAALILFLVVCHRLLETPFWNVNAARLMPSLALAHGIDYYVMFPPGGPLYSTLYGPLVAIVYLPATWFSTPNSAVLAGAAITTLLCFSAVALLHFAPSKAGRSSADPLAFLTAGFLICYLEPLKYSCFNIHADGPGLALGAFACAAVYAPQKWRAALPVSALCAVLAVFSKQPFLPVPIAILVYLWLAEGRARALRYLLWLVAAGTLAGAAALLAEGPQRLYHCLIWLPAHHPWNEPSRILSAIQALRSFIRVSMPVPVLLLTCAAFLWTSGRLNGPGLRALASSRAAPLLLVGIALLPFSIAGRAKTGGDVNSLSFALFFLTCGLTVLLAEASHIAASGSARRLALSALVAMTLSVAVSEAPLILDIPARARQLPQSPQTIAFEYLKRHPGEAYFPWFPLSHFYAEHQFRHYGFGIADRLMAGEALSGADFRAYIPRDPRIVAFSSDGAPLVFGYNLMRYLPEYKYQVKDPELPGWLLYSKSP